MRDLRDFNISEILMNKNPTGIGQIKEKLISDRNTIFKFSENTVIVKEIGSGGLKIEFNPESIDKDLIVPHREPALVRKILGYKSILPDAGDRFNVTIKRGEETLMSPFSNQDSIGFLNIGSELFEMLNPDNSGDVTTVSFRLSTDYGIYGVGETFNRFNKCGTSVITFPFDNYALNSYEVYKSRPVFITASGIGIIFPEYLPIEFDFGTKMHGLVNITIPSKAFSFYIVIGRPKDFTKTLSDMFGKPEMPPEWSFGLWISRWAGIGYRDTNEVKDIVQKFKNEDIPMDVISMDPQWLDNYIAGVTQACNFRWDRSRFNSDDELGTYLRSEGKRLCLWVNPYVALNDRFYKTAEKCLFQDASGKVALVPNQDKNPNKPDRGMFDFTRKECFDLYSNLIADLMKRSKADAVMTDFGETVPPEAVDDNNHMGFVLRNKVGDLYQISAYTGVKSGTGRGIVWGRSGSLLSQTCPVQWGGDSSSTWEGMRTALRAALSASMSGVYFNAFDTGGFAGKPDEDLYLRWVALGALFSHFKIHGTTPREPWYYGTRSVEIFRKIVKLRYNLMPYIIESARECLEESIPFVRPLVFDYPEDPAVFDIDDEFILGNKLLVCPITHEGEERYVYLPRGMWAFFDSGKRVKGRRWIKVRKDLDEVAVFVKAGSKIEIAKGNPMNVTEALKAERTSLTF